MIDGGVPLAARHPRFLTDAHRIIMEEGRDYGKSSISSLRAHYPECGRVLRSTNMCFLHTRRYLHRAVIVQYWRRLNQQQYGIDRFVEFNHHDNADDYRWFGRWYDYMHNRSQWSYDLDDLPLTARSIGADAISRSRALYVE